MGLHYTVLHKEGDLRFDLVRVRENTGGCFGGAWVCECSVVHCVFMLVCNLMHISPCTVYTPPARPLLRPLTLLFPPQHTESIVHTSSQCTHTPLACLNTQSLLHFIHHVDYILYIHHIHYIHTHFPTESIAFYSGEHRESTIAASRVSLLIHTLRRKVLWLAGLNLWQNVLSYATILLPPMLLAPRYFAGEIEFGVVSQVCINH